jgi:hypothetical protein
MKHPGGKYDSRVQDSANLIPDDEPVFLIRGQDKLAPLIVRLYADVYKLMGGDPDNGDTIKIHAQAMHVWQVNNGNKLAD